MRPVPASRLLTAGYECCLRLPSAPRTKRVPRLPGPRRPTRVPASPLRTVAANWTGWLTPTLTTRTSAQLPSAIRTHWSRNRQLGTHRSHRPRAAVRCWTYSFFPRVTWTPTRDVQRETLTNERVSALTGTQLLNWRHPSSAYVATNYTFRHRPTLRRHGRTKGPGECTSLCVIDPRVGGRPVAR
jgi:hypothetical protein